MENILLSPKILPELHKWCLEKLLTTNLFFGSILKAGSWWWKLLKVVRSWCLIEPIHLWFLVLRRMQRFLSERFQETRAEWYLQLLRCRWMNVEVMMVVEVFKDQHRRSEISVSYDFCYFFGFFFVGNYLYFYQCTVIHIGS